MITFLVILVIALFAALLFLNFYFRFKVLRVYKRLVKNKVEFGASHIFNNAKMEKEILPRYPRHSEDIKTFVHHMQHSMRLAILLISLITILGMILARQN